MNSVFVLGSGFSSGAGAPLTGTVLETIFHEGRVTRQLSELKSYISAFLYQGRSDWVKTSSLEEVLSRLDIIRHYKPYPHVDYNEVIYYEELLLKEFTGLLTPERTCRLEDSYRIFADIINSGDLIITFNYDLVIENLLTGSGKDFFYPDLSFVDYGALPQKRSICVRSSVNLCETASSVRIFKLHGSINMYYCPVCGQIFCFPESVTAHPVPGASGKENDIPALLKCLKCSRQDQSIQLRHFIIAPTLFKSYSLPALRSHWFTALKTLAGAEEIFFIGYSLPLADILSYQLFDFAARLANRKQSVFLVNGPGKHHQRFGQLYGDSVCDTAMTFEDWTESKKR